MRSLAAVLAVLTLGGIGVMATAQQPSEPSTTTLTGTTTVVRIAQPNEKLVVNGRIVTVAELMEVSSSPDSALGQRLHTPAKQSRESLKPSVQSRQQDQSCPVATGSAAGPACVETPSTVPNPATKLQP